ncbi:MAG: histidine phosphatase family protein [Clostridia bacterium]|nr:histidine phosphatase family protein [Clostridia bacterium]
MKLLLARHGESAGNAKGLVFGWSDWPLTGRGRAQAEALAGRLGGVSFSRVVCSALRRARETADICAQLRGLPVEIDPDLNEQRMGRWEDLTFDEARASDPAAFQAMLDDWTRNPPPDGESFDALAARAGKALSRVIADGRDALVVAHGGTIAAALVTLGRMSREAALRLDLPCGGFIETDWEPEQYGTNGRNE